MVKILVKQLLLVVFIFASIAANAKRIPKEELDSILQVKPKGVYEQFNNYLVVSIYYSAHNKTLSRAYIDSAKYLLDEVRDSTYLLNQYYSAKGVYYYQVGLYDSSIVYCCERLNYIDPNDILKYGKVYSIIGRVYLKIDQFDSALYYFHKSISTFQRTDTNTFDLIKSTADSYRNIGTLFLNFSSYDSAITYYYKAMELYDRNGQKLNRATVQLNVGNIYLVHQEYDKALESFHMVLNDFSDYKGNWRSTKANLYTNMGLCYKALGVYDTALVCYDTALQIRKKIGSQRSVAGIYDNIGNLKKALDEFDEALKYYQLALNIRKVKSNPRSMAASYGNIGLMYAEINQNTKAINYLNKALALADSNRLVEVSIECRRGLSGAYRNLGNYKKAYDYYVSFRDLNDSIHSLRIEEKLNEYKQKYESEKKDRLIEKLEEDQKLLAANEEKQVLINEKQGLILNGLAATAVLLIIILFILQRFFKMKRRADQDLIKKNEVINQQKTLELMKELEVSSIQSFVEGQEKERARIAGDLHDRLGSLLSTVKLHFNSLDVVVEKDNQAKKQFDFALQLLDNSVEEVRAVSRNLSKGVLIQFGLLAAVENMRDAINSAGKLKMEVIVSGVKSRLDSEMEIVLFRVIQELITNVIRHAHTDEVFVQFSGTSTSLSIVIEDHGVGFDLNNIKSDGIGLENLKNRIQSVSGTLTIDSIIGQGTTIIIEIPFQNGDDNDDESAEE